MPNIISPYELTEDERSTIDNALTVARERFMENATALRDPERAGTPGIGPQPHHRRLAEHFDRQALDCSRLAVKLAAADTITTVTSPAEEEHESNNAG